MHLLDLLLIPMQNESAMGGRKFGFDEARVTAPKWNCVLLSFSHLVAQRARGVPRTPMIVGAARVFERVCALHRSVIYTILFDDFHHHRIRSDRSISINTSRHHLFLQLLSSFKSGISRINTLTFS